MSKESLWCSVRWWLLFLELQLPFPPLDLPHIPALLRVTLEPDTASWSQAQHPRPSSGLNVFKWDCSVLAELGP